MVMEAAFAQITPEELSRFLVNRGQTGRFLIFL
jgi:hypothetical protein